MSDALPYALDYRSPYAEALVGVLLSGPLLVNGFNLETGSYEILAAANQAVIRFDASGGGRAALAYKSPVVVVGGLSGAPENLLVEISTNAGHDFTPLGSEFSNLTSPADEASLGVGRRLFQYLGDIPGTATGSSAVAFRFTVEAVAVPTLSRWGGAVAFLVVLVAAVVTLKRSLAAA